MVGEDLVEQDAPALGHAEALVEPPHAGDDGVLPLGLVPPGSPVARPLPSTGPRS